MSDSLTDKVLAKVGSGNKKAKGLPMRYRNVARKARRQRSIAKLPEKKLRHVFKHNGVAAAQARVEKFPLLLTPFRALCHRAGIEPTL